MLPLNRKAALEQRDIQHKLIKLGIRVNLFKLAVANIIIHMTKEPKPYRRKKRETIGGPY
jgi:hypothetical protein